MWYDNTGGLKSDIGEESFNNIVYSTYYVIARKLSGKLNQKDIDDYVLHNTMNEDSNGLYSPKNSHDNLTTKICGNKFLGLPYHKNMNLLEACKSANWHPKDVILYGFELGSPIIKNLCRLLLFIPALACIIACLTRWKVRPKVFDRDVPRWRLWLDFKRVYLGRFEQRVGYKDEYLLSNGKIYTVYFHQNDGKLLSVIKLLTFKKESLILSLTGKLCQYILIKRYKQAYMYQLIGNYFKNPQHPATLAWGEVNDSIL